MRPAHLRAIVHETSINALLSLQHDACHSYWDIDEDQLRDAARALNIVYRRYPIRDFDVADMRRQLPRAVAALARLHAARQRTYVHCTAGLGRAPLVVLAYLVLVAGWAPEAAGQRIHAARPGAVPAWEALHGAIEDLTLEHRGAIERRAYALYQEHVNADPVADWVQAQREVLRTALLDAAARTQ